MIWSSDFSTSALRSSVGLLINCPRHYLVHREALGVLSDQVLGPIIFASARTTQLLNVLYIRLTRKISFEDRRPFIKETNKNVYKIIDLDWSFHFTQAAYWYKSLQVILP